MGIFQGIGNALGEGNVLNELGILERYAGHHDESLALHQRALEIGQRISNQELQCHTFSCLGHTYVAKARLFQAQAAYEQALERADGSQPQQKLHPLSGLAQIAAIRNEPESTKKLFQEIKAILNIRELNSAEDPQSFLQNVQQALGIVNDEELTRISNAIAKKVTSSSFVSEIT